MITIDVYLLDSLMWDLVLAAVMAYIVIAFAGFIMDHIPFIG